MKRARLEMLPHVVTNACGAAQGLIRVIHVMGGQLQGQHHEPPRWHLQFGTGARRSVSPVKLVQQRVERQQQSDDLGLTPAAWLMSVDLRATLATRLVGGAGGAAVSVQRSGAVHGRGSCDPAGWCGPTLRCLGAVRGLGRGSDSHAGFPHQRVDEDMRPWLGLVALERSGEDEAPPCLV